MPESKATKDSPPHTSETEVTSVSSNTRTDEKQFQHRTRLIIVGIILLAGFGLFVQSHVRRDGAINESTIIQETPSAEETPTPTPFPFQELTVPYLRNQTYSSELGELVRAYETASYTAYETTYISEGFVVHGLLTIPNGDQPLNGWPAVIFVHGYIPPNEYQTRTQYYDYVDYLAQNELVVFKIDLRGHGQSEGEAGGAYYSSDYIIDVLNARAALQTETYIKPDGIGLWGHSMAGNVVLRAFVVAPDLPAIVIWAGAVYTYEDMQENGIDDNSYRPPSVTSQRQEKRQALRDMYGNFDSQSQFWHMVAPTNYLDGVAGAIQIHHATGDPVVSVEYSRGLVQRLAGTSIEYELYEYDTGGHNITGSSFTRAMQRTVEFFQTHMN